MERHRLIWAFFERQTDLLDGRPKRLLHIAPEPALTERLSSIAGLEYLSADLNCRKAMVKMDITQIPSPDNSYDVIYCSHVLEHVPDDRRAMRELYRVLRPTGWAVLQVPIKGEQTDEDPSVTDPVERERRFGQQDHVRIYGRDYFDRLAEAGFVVRAWKAEEFLSSEEIQMLRVDPCENVVECRQRYEGCEVSDQQAPELG